MKWFVLRLCVDRSIQRHLSMRRVLGLMQNFRGLEWNLMRLLPDLYFRGCARIMGSSSISNSAINFILCDCLDGKGWANHRFVHSLRESWCAGNGDIAWEQSRYFWLFRTHPFINTIEGLCWSADGCLYAQFKLSRLGSSRAVCFPGCEVMLEHHL